MEDKKALVPVKQIETLILTIRGQRVMLDEDLALLYGVTTKRLNEQVKRNRERFPEDFMFQLTYQEVRNLKSQFATSSVHGGRRKPPLAFTEHGAFMAANVLNSERAVEVSIYIVRAFSRLREMLSGHKEMARQLEELERRLDTHDEAIDSIIQALKKLMAPPDKTRRPIGLRLKP